MSELTPKQARFVAEYLIDLNATQAAIRAGYSEATASVIGCENLTKPYVAEAIKAAKAERMSRIKIDADWVLQRAIELHETCLTENDRTNARQTLELIGKHVDIAAFKERTELSGVVGFADVSEDIQAVNSMLSGLAERQAKPATLQ